VNDWLDVEDADDWLKTDESASIDAEKASDTQVPGLPVAAVAGALEAQKQRERFMSAWALLSDGQRVYLNTWRECRFNSNKAMRVLSGTTHSVTKTTVGNWQSNDEYEYVRTLLRAASVTEILSKDYLAVRQEDIVETLLTPKPVLHQGVATGHYEVEAGAAGKANEVLLRMGGHLKEEKQDINIGLTGPSLVIQVVQPTGQVIDVTPKHVNVELPAPADGT
jgi:hypothetical protein